MPALNGAAPSQAITMPINPTTVLPNAVLPAQVVSMAPEPIGTPSECLLLKNMFDPATEVSVHVSGHSGRKVTFYVPGTLMKKNYHIAV